MEPKLDDKTLLLKIIEPDGSVQTTSELKTGSDGGFKHQLIFEQSGNWELVATWAGNSNYQFSEQKLMVTVIVNIPTVLTPDEGETMSVDPGFARGTHWGCGTSMKVRVV